MKEKMEQIYLLLRRKLRRPFPEGIKRIIFLPLWVAPPAEYVTGSGDLQQLFQQDCYDTAFSFSYPYIKTVGDTYK